MIWCRQFTLIFIVYVTMKTSNRASISQSHLSETSGKLNKTCVEISSDEARLWLINQMFQKKITTRDIYHFALKQSSLRTVNKELDSKTVTAAMLAKQKDLKIVLFRLRKERKKLESILLDELGGRKYK